jgi:predicted Zn-dependent protease
MKGKEPPQFLSTHPSSGNRINDLRLLIPKVKIEYPKIENFKI